jgi:putative heme-binding domain-containing protein
MQLAAIEGLARYGAPEIAPLLWAKLKSQPPNMRRAIIGTLLANGQRTKFMLDAVETGEFSIRELDQGQSNQLANHSDAAIRERAQKLIAASAPADRKKVIDDYQSALKLKADAVQGREIFSKNCTTCHQIGKLGVNVAPDIADSRVTTQEALLVNILDPNRAIDNNYFSYTVITNDGKLLNGILSAETATSVTLRQAEGKTVTLLREEIDELHSDGISLMPVGLEKNITPQQMADLISFIKNWRYLEADIPVSAGQ